MIRNNIHNCARMHSSARRAGYPSDSSRAARQQTRTRPAGGGPLRYHYAVERFRHLRHRSWPPCGRAVPPVCSAWCRPGREPTATAPGRRCGPAGPGAVRHRRRSWAAVAGPGAVPRQGLLNLRRGTRRCHRTRPPQRTRDGAARAAVRAGPRGPLTVPHVAECRVATRAFGGPDRRAASSFAGSGAVRPGPRPAPAAGLGRAGCAPATRTTLPPEPRAAAEDGQAGPRAGT
jgi:hypothetical protein